MILEVILFLISLLIFAILRDRKPGSMPPGPMEIPFVGNMGVETMEQANELRKQYGPIFTTRIGALRQVTIADYDLAKEAMASSECSDRTPLFKAFRMDTEVNGGVVASEGMQWVHDRRFVLRHLRDLGMGKSYLDIAINDEARAMVEDLKSLNDESVPAPTCFRRVVLNVVWQLVSGKRYELTSTECDKIFDVLERLRDHQSLAVFMEDFYPIVKIIPKCIAYKLFNFKIVYEFREEMTKIINETIKEHEATLDEDNPRDLVDNYLIAMKKQENDYADNRFKIPYLHQIVSDLFAAGSDTVTNMLRWVVFCMVKYPETMRKCQEEIDREIPSDEQISFTDKPRLPYTEAYTAEVLRASSMFHVNVARYTNKEYKIGGYIIPKDTIVTTDSYFIHHDPQFWDDPHSFKPERFIDDNGKFKAKPGRSFAFGSGRRECIGVPLAMMEFFLFSSALLQNFTIELPKGEVLKETMIQSLGARMVPHQNFIYRYRGR